MIYSFYKHFRDRIFTCSYLHLETTVWLYSMLVVFTNILNKWILVSIQNRKGGLVVVEFDISSVSTEL